MMPMELKSNVVTESVLQLNAPYNTAISYVCINQSKGSNTVWLSDVRDILEGKNVDSVVYTSIT